jgi:hypothetical protein
MATLETSLFNSLNISQSSLASVFDFPQRESLSRPASIHANVLPSVIHTEEAPEIFQQEFSSDSDSRE